MDEDSGYWMHVDSSSRIENSIRSCT